MKDTSFGVIIMACYNEDFEKDKRLKFNSNVLKIADQYDMNSKCFEIGGKRIQITIEDVAPTSVYLKKLMIIMNKTRALKDRSFIKDYFRNMKNISKNLK